MYWQPMPGVAQFMPVPSTPEEEEGVWVHQLCPASSYLV